ncbi:hypothetical protein MLPF_2036 [Mycobacterium lepromatosis]|nr:hypothetical protein MLPF_2036 [Mycobacterium lepromatosis]
MRARGYLRRLTRRLTENLDTAIPRFYLTRYSVPDAQRVIDCQRAQEVTMVSTLRSVETNGYNTRHRVGAYVAGGGSAGQARQRGGKVIYNPHYEIQR